MNTITRETKVKVQDNVKEAIAWLEKEHPRGVELVYIDYRDHFEPETLQKVLKEEDFDLDPDDGSYESVQEILKNYREDIEADELSDEVEEAMSEWLYDHNESNPIKDLLRNTGYELFYIETSDYAENLDDKKQEKEIIKKYAKTPAEKKEIEYVLHNQFYNAPISFYFYASPLSVYNAIYNSTEKYITVKGTYFSTIDRVQGSNWLGNNGIFNLTILREDFIKNIYLDKAKGNGYSWDHIAGQTGYDEAEIGTSKTIAKNSILLKPETSEAQKREQELQEHWDKTKTCTFGDMNWNRHKGEKPYSNNYPYGNKCETCGTFWID